MVDRPYTLLSCCVSLDGYLDNADIARLRLSNDDDFARVDSVRAGCDAIMVGAQTIRQDDPRLLVRSATLRADRLAAGLPESPVKVTVTRSGRLEPSAQFFTRGSGDKLVYCAGPDADPLRSRLGDDATVIHCDDPVDLDALLADLSARGVDRLMVEGGGTIHTQFLTAGLADELQLVVAPMFVGDSRSRRFVDDGAFPWTSDRRAQLAGVQQIGDVALLRYALSPRFGTSQPVTGTPSR
jgi:5-amino-6-(5-phosphoribosylamino)uracil reductase